MMWRDERRPQAADPDPWDTEKADRRRIIVPRTLMGRTVYGKAELAAMTDEERQAVRVAHRPHAAVQPGEIPPELDELATAELDRQMDERLSRQHREAS
jgi:hypothetical protein